MNILRNESQILRRNIEIDKSKRCEIIPGLSIQAKSEGKIASQYYKNVFSDEENFVIILKFNSLSRFWNYFIST